MVRIILPYYWYWYSALGPVWAENSAQSGDWYCSGTLQPGQVLRGSLPLLSPFYHIFLCIITCPNFQILWLFGRRRDVNRSVSDAGVLKVPGSKHSPDTDSLYMTFEILTGIFDDNSSLPAG